MKTIILEGTLGKTFGTHHRFEVLTAREAVQALCQHKGFEDQFRLGAYRVKYTIAKKTVDIMAETIDLRSRNATHITFTPAPHGASNNPLVNIVIGAIVFFVAPVIGAAIVSGAGASAATGLVISSALASIGTALIITGVAGVLSPAPKIPGIGDTGDGQRGESDYLFNGPLNTALQGGSVPICFGRVRSGSVVVSSGVLSESLNPGALPAVVATPAPSNQKQPNIDRKDSSGGGGRGGHNNGRGDAGGGFGNGGGGDASASRGRA